MVDTVLGEILELNAGAVNFCFDTKPRLPSPPPSSRPRRASSQKKATKTPPGARGRTLTKAEQRLVTKFGGLDVLYLDREQFAPHRAAVKLTVAEQRILEKLRRLLLRRKYAKISRDKQVATLEALERRCAELSVENDRIRLKISCLATLLDDDGLN